MEWCCLPLKYNALQGSLSSEEELWHCSTDFTQMVLLTTILHYSVFFLLLALELSTELVKTVGLE